MTATRPEPAPIAGRFIRLEPLRKDDTAALRELHAAIGHPNVFTAGYGGGPASYRDNPDAFVEWAQTAYQWNSGNVYLVRLVGGPHDGVAVGTSTLGDFDLHNERAHIGWTAYDPRVWGTAVNVEAKLLLLTLAFENGFGRVKIQTDNINERSKAAIAGIGATFEGRLRRHVVRADGSHRDTAVFSILVDEWDRVRDGLEQRLQKHDGRPVLYRSLTSARPDAPDAPRP